MLGGDQSDPRMSRVEDVERCALPKIAGPSRDLAPAAMVKK
jgi:hypothetical protein